MGGGIKYRKRVFAMDEAELRAALSLLVPDEDFVERDRETMQEELVQWLLAEGLSARHEFLLYREQEYEKKEGEDSAAVGDTEQQQQPPPQIYLLSRRARGCQCCGGESGKASPRLSPCPSPIPTPRRTPSPQPLQQQYYTAHSSSTFIPLPIDRQYNNSNSRSESPSLSAQILLVGSGGRGRKIQNMATSAAAAPTVLAIPDVVGSRQIVGKDGRRSPAPMAPMRTERGGATTTGVVITGQPMPMGLAAAKDANGRGILVATAQQKDAATKKKKSRSKECRAECGKFCVDLLSSMK